MPIERDESTGAATWVGPPPAGLKEMTGLQGHPDQSGLPRGMTRLIDPATGKILYGFQPDVWNWSAGQRAGVDDEGNPLNEIPGSLTSSNSSRDTFSSGDPFGYFMQGGMPYYVTDSGQFDTKAPPAADEGFSGTLSSVLSGIDPAWAALSLGPLAGQLAAGGGGALAGGDLAAFEYPTLTAAEAATYGAPATAGYTGGAGATLSEMLASGSNLPPEVYSAGGATEADVARTGFDFSGAGDATAGQVADLTGAAGFGPPASLPISSASEGVGQDVAVPPGTPPPPAGVGGSGVYLPAAGAATTAYTLSKMLKDMGLDVTGNESMIDAAGRSIPGLIEAFSKSQQANSMADLTKQFTEYGAPSRARYESSMTPGFDVNSIPGYRSAVDDSMEATLRKLSTQGNPYGSPGALIEANKSVVRGTALPALQEYQRLNLAGGGQANLNAAVPGMAAGEIGANAGIWGGLGDAAASVFTPKTSLADLLKQMKGSGFNFALA